MKKYVLGLLVLCLPFVSIVAILGAVKYNSPNKAIDYKTLNYATAQCYGKCDDEHKLCYNSCQQDGPDCAAKCLQQVAKCQAKCR